MELGSRLVNSGAEKSAELTHTSNLPNPKAINVFCFKAQSWGDLFSHVRKLKPLLFNEPP